MPTQTTQSSKSALKGTVKMKGPVGAVAIEDYLSYLVNDKQSSENTVAAYRNDLSQLYEHLRTVRTPGRQLPVVGNEDDSFNWGSVNKARLEAFIGSLKEKGYASATLARKVAAVKSYFHWMAAYGLVKIDPTDCLEYPKVGKTLPRTLTPEETDGLLLAPLAKIGPEATRDSAMLRLLYATGMRVSEMMQLDVEDVDMSSDYVRCLGKAGRERHIPFDHKTHMALFEYLQEHGSRSILTRHLETSALFVNHRGERLTRQGFWLILKGHARNAGLSGSITPHTLRHSFAIHLLSNNANLRDVSELLGHANLGTMQIYTQVVGSKVAKTR